MPLTRDLIGIGINKLGSGDESGEMNGADLEFSDFEKTLAQKSIRRSVVKDKLNWSC